jgi:hypothetical protein
VTVEKGGSSGFVDQGVDVFDLPPDRVGLRVPTVPPAPAVIAVDRESLREKLRELRFRAGRARCHGSIDQDERWAVALLLERDRGAVP